MHAVRGTHLGCCYIFAQASLELGKHVEGLSALEKSKSSWLGRNTWNCHNETRRHHLPDAAAVYCLEGKLFKAYKDMGKAVDCWVEALKLNPFMWDAFLGLCDAGAQISTSNIYKLTPEMVTILQAIQRPDGASTMPAEKLVTSNGPLQAQPTNHINPFADPPDPFTSSRSKLNGAGAGYSSSVLWEKLNGSKLSVATVSAAAEGGTDTRLGHTEIGEFLASKQSWEPPQAPTRKGGRPQEAIPESWMVPPPKMRTGSIRSRARSKAEPEEPAVLQDPLPPAAPTKRTVSGQVAQTSAQHHGVTEGARRSVRLLNTARAPATSSSKLSSIRSTFGLSEGRDIKKPKAASAKGRSATAATVGRVVSGNRSRTGSSDALEVDSKDARQAISGVPPVPSIPIQKPSRTESVVSKEVEALATLLDLFKRLSDAQLALSTYNCLAAIQAYNSLPSSQRETPFVLSQVGKAYYEQSSYADAEKFFIRVKALSPSRLDDMEVYSTVLWHMKNEVELAYLAHELVDIERSSPQAWCAIGNSFSLQRDHDQALKCFRRATQLDPQFAYGFTLQGHEHVANEEFEKALDSYRSAVGADPRHYNAWYGLGKVYEKMGKWGIAEQHYRTAANINPTNAVLVCCIGMVLEKQKNGVEALEMYTRACILAPHSALSRFKKARCLMGLGMGNEALTELNTLKDQAPDEANVWFLMGRLYKGLKLRGHAIRCFTMALNLDPKVCGRLEA